MGNMEQIVEIVKERLPQEILMKLNCTSCGSYWYETSFYPFTVLLETIYDVFVENNIFRTSYYILDDCVDVVNEITGLGFVTDPGSVWWDESDDRLLELYDNIFPD